VPEKATVTAVLFQPLTFGGGVAVAAAVGGVVSMLKPMVVTRPLLPALSVQVPVALCPLPLALSVTGGEQPPAAIPESVSVPKKVIVTAVLFQPLEFGGGYAYPSAGGVVSILRFAADTGALTLPAMSVQVPADDVRPTPWVDTVTGDEQPAIPEVESVPLNMTVTAELFQPLPLGMGEGEALATGGVASRLMVTLCEVVPPTLVAVQVTT